jgi:hypothetical protein
VAFGKRKQVEDEIPEAETPEVEAPEVESPAEEAPADPVCYAPGEGSMNHPF